MKYKSANLEPKQDPEIQGLWSARTTAQYCEYQTPVTILRAFRRGELPGFKINPRTVRFAPSDVKAWLAKSRIG